MRQSSRGWMLCALAAPFVLLAAVPVSGQSRDSGANAPRDKADKSAERVSGVIIKAEPIARGSTSASSAEKANPAGRTERQAIRLTINTAAVWRDWARDQATANAAESPKKAAARGADSVATRGEPVSKDTVVVVHLNPDSKVETRFRTLQDETGKGAKSPEAARRQDAAEAHGEAAGSSAGSSTSKNQAAKPVRFQASDLRPGLFVEVDFRAIKAGNLASTVAVIRPIESAPPARARGGK